MMSWRPSVSVHGGIVTFAKAEGLTSKDFPGFWATQ